MGIMDDKTLLAVQIKSPKDLGFTFMVFLELVAIFHYHMYVRVNSLHSIDPHILKKKNWTPLCLCKLVAVLSILCNGCFVPTGAAPCELAPITAGR